MISARLFCLKHFAFLFKNCDITNTGATCEPEWKNTTHFQKSQSNAYVYTL